MAYFWNKQCYLHIWCQWTIKREHQSPNRNLSGTATCFLECWAKNCTSLHYRLFNTSSLAKDLIRSFDYVNRSWRVHVASDVNVTIRILTHHWLTVFFFFLFLLFTEGTQFEPKGEVSCYFICLVPFFFHMFHNGNCLKLYLCSAMMIIKISRNMATDVYYLPVLAVFNHFIQKKKLCTT